MVKVKGLFCQTVFMEIFFGERRKACFVKPFSWRMFFGERRKACFVKPFSWKMLFGERLVLPNRFLGECLW